jgi:hypothetical protein
MSELFHGKEITMKTLFDEYLVHLPKEKVLFGFPGAGGSIEEQIVHYIDSEKPDGT